MHHTEEVTFTIKGLSAKPKTYSLPRLLANEVLAYLETHSDGQRIPAQKVLPQAFDPIEGPATILRGARYRKELTQKQLAEQLGIRQHHLSEMEHGKRPIGKEMAKKLAEVLGVNYKVFL